MRRFPRTPATLSILISITVLIIIYCLYVPGRPERQGDIAILAKGYLGVPYRYGGSTPAGFDCSGFIMFLFHQCGKELPRTADKQATIGIPVSLDSLQPGNLLFFAATDEPGISHTGLYIGDHKFIHASSTAKKVITSNLNEPYWQKAFRGAREVMP